LIIVIEIIDRGGEARAYHNIGNVYFFFSLWDISKPDIETFIEEANLDHPTIKFTTEISDTETVFLDAIVQRLKIQRKIDP